MHCSLNPLTGLIPLVGMWFNITFGGIGVGFLGLFTYIIIGVFICGMMVGRTPEYLGKKVETREMKYALPALLMHPLCILGGMAIFCLIPSWGRDTVLNSGFHGFTEMLYEFTSASANNGSGFEGLGDNTAPWNIGLRARDADRAFHSDYLPACDLRFALCQKTGSGDRRHTENRHPAFWCRDRRNRDFCRCAAFSAGCGARSDC